MYNYCHSDVDILRRECITYRELFITISDIDPFQYCTLAGVSIAIYSSKFLEPNTVAVCEESSNDLFSIK